jgi:23S rRNA (adenine2503-C2)-methyltransferase
LCGLFCCALDVVRADIKGLPASFVAQLQAAGVTTGRSVVHHTLQAPDGTSKLLLQLAEGRLVEAVGIPAQEGGKQRLTVCVSSQVRLLAQCGVF